MGTINHVRSTTSPAAPAPVGRLPWDSLLAVLAAFVLMQVWRVQDLFPALAVNGLPVLTSVIAVALFYLDRDPRRRLNGLDDPVVSVVIGITILVALSIPGSLYPGASMQFLLKDYLRSVLLMLLIGASVRGLADLRRFAWLHIGGLTLFCAVILARAQIGSDGRLNAVAYYDENDLATLIVCTLPLALYLWQAPSGIVARLLLAAAAVLLMTTLGKTGSRGGFLGFLAVAGYLLLRFRGLSGAKRAAAVVVLAILLVGLASDRYFERIETILHPSADYNWTGHAETGRMEVWQRGVGYMLSHPVLGVGARAFPVAEGTLSAEARARGRYGQGFKWSAAHNSFIEIGAELGVLGLILFVVLLAAAFRALTRARRGPVRGAALLSQALTACLVGYVVTAVFLSQAYSGYLYTLLGMTLGLARIAFPVPAAAPLTGRFFGPPTPPPRDENGMFPLSGRLERDGR